MGQSITLPLPACLLPIVLDDAISWPGTGCLRGQHLRSTSSFTIIEPRGPLLGHHFFHIWKKNLVFSNAVMFPVLTFGLMLYCYGWSVCDLNKVSHGWPSSYLVHKCLRRCCVFVHVAFITRVIHLVLFPQLQFKVWATFINATLPCCLIFLYWVDFVFLNLKFTASTITPASIILMIFFC